MAASSFVNERASSCSLVVEGSNLHAMRGPALVAAAMNGHHDLRQTQEQQTIQITVNQQPK
jgi:hypothetical protein